MKILTSAQGEKKRDGICENFIKKLLCYIENGDIRKFNGECFTAN